LAIGLWLSVIYMRLLAIGCWLLAFITSKKPIANLNSLLIVTPRVMAVSFKVDDKN